MGPPQGCTGQVTMPPAQLPASVPRPRWPRLQSEGCDKQKDNHPPSEPGWVNLALEACHSGDRDAVLGHTMASPLCLILLSASLASLLSPGASGKCPSTCRVERWPQGGGERWGIGMMLLNLHGVDNGCRPDRLTGDSWAWWSQPRWLRPGVPPCGWKVRQWVRGHEDR